MDFKDLIDQIKRNTAAQVEQTKRWRLELGLPELEPTELDLLLGAGDSKKGPAVSRARGVELPSREPEGVELPTREPEGVELLSREPEGVELPTREPDGVELLSREPEGVELPSREPEGVELPSQEPEEVELSPEQDKEDPLLSLEPRAENKGEEVKKIPPQQPRPPPLKTSQAPDGAVPQPVLLDTLPECPDLQLLGLEIKPKHHQTQCHQLGHQAKSCPSAMECDVAACNLASEAEGVELPSQEPEEVELSPEQDKEDPLLSLEPRAENKGEEVKKIPPQQPRPPPLKTSQAPDGAVPQPVLLDTLPECPDLQLLGLEIKPEHHQTQFLSAPPAFCCAPPGG
ncbi:UNVERIFIED_CONTAM: hypothetical protein FKN15_057735 [Acipenser sinensis]